MSSKRHNFLILLLKYFSVSYWHINDCFLIREVLKTVSIMTVDSAQGQECDVILFSCVRTNNIGFMADSNRLNVALTRAKHALYIACNFKSLKVRLTTFFFQIIFRNYKMVLKVKHNERFCCLLNVFIRRVKFGEIF